MSSLFTYLRTGVKHAVAIMETANNIAGGPGIGIAIGVLSHICDICDTAANNKQRFQHIGKHAKAFLALVNQSNQDKVHHQELDDLIRRFIADIEFVEERCDKYANKKLHRYILRPGKVDEALGECEQRLVSAKDIFQMESTMILARGQKVLQDGQKKLLENQSTIQANQLRQLADTTELKEGQTHLRTTTEGIDEKTDALVALSQTTQNMVHEGFAALQAERIETWIQSNPGQTRELLALGRADRYVALPDEDREQYRTLAAALIEQGGGALVDLDGMIVKGDDVVKDYVWIGYLKGKGSTSEAQQKYWVRKIDIRVTPEDAAEGTNTKASRRVREEMRIAATIRHPNIMRLFGMFIDVDKFGATAYTVSKYEEYKILDEYLIANPQENPTGIFAGIASGLARLHEGEKSYLVHGDMRCCKVAVTLDGTPKIFDFTLSVVIKEVTEDPTLITKMSRDPSLYWTAPEILVSYGHDAIPTKASDVWSFGVTMIEGLSVQEPYAREDDRHPFPWLRSVREFMRYSEELYEGRKGIEYKNKPTSEYAQKWGTPGVWKVILECLTVKPNQRPSMDQVERRLQELSC